MRFVLFFVLIFGTAHLWAQTSIEIPKFDPSLEWKSIKTEHFWIHYHQGLEPLAVRLSVISEKVHKKMSAQVGWEPYLRTDVVLIDNMYSANGFALPFPYNRIQIYIKRPEPHTALHNYDKWLEQIFTHEYTHTLNSDIISGVPALSRYTLGRVCFPNLFIPTWMLEGSAVHYESKGHSFGRNNSSYANMIVRTEVLSGRFKPLSIASARAPREWPRGKVPYLYGGLFIQFIEKKYGDNSFAKVFHENGDNIIPYLVNTNARDVYNKSFDELWKEWEEHITKKYTGEAERIKKNGLTKQKFLSAEENDSLLPRFARDGNSIYYIAMSNKHDDTLVQYDPGNGEKKELCSVRSPGSISESPEGTLFLSDIEYYRSYSLFRDVFTYTDSYDQLSEKLRADYIDISGDGKAAVFIQNDRDNYSLIISDKNFKKQDKIIDSTPVQLAYARFSPSGKKIVFTIKDSKGNNDLVLLDPATRAFTRLTNNRYNNITPAWHPGGRKIVFSSDAAGIYNIYEYNLDTNSVSQITNLLGGAFSPDISPSGDTIVFSSYQGRGHRVATIKYPVPIQEGEISLPGPLEPEFFSRPGNPGSPAKDAVRSSDYSPWNSILPSAFLPLIASEEYAPAQYDFPVGIVTAGTDTLYQHLYMLYLYAYPVQKRASVDISYTYYGLYPDITIGYLDNHLFFGDDEFPWNNTAAYFARELKRGGYTSLAFKFLKYDYQQIVQLSYLFERNYIHRFYPVAYASTDINHTNPLYNIMTFQEINLARLQAYYYISNARKYPYSVGPENGRSFLIVGDMYQEWLGSDAAFYKLRAAYAEYLPGIFDNNVLMLRLRGGICFNNPETLSAPYTLGRFTRGETGAPASGEDSWGLRGYPAGTIYATRTASLTAEYSLPLVQTDAAPGMIPFMFNDLWLDFFVEYGNVWDGYPEFKDFKLSAGVELNINLTLGYVMPFTASIGFARGFNSYGENQVYFAISTFIEGIVYNKSKR
ncbi:MAG: BamA/TamA family outer membrane protein [bacterium]|nr:BamA/TamA family outer membrane protein [bacterium]